MLAVACELGLRRTTFTGAMAPAMNSAMWKHVATQRNILQLRSDDVEILEPDEGWLSCRQKGQGRLMDIDQILETLITAAKE